MDPVITSLHPKVVDAINKTIAECKIRGMSIGLESGLRDSKKQEALYALGRTVINPSGATAGKPLGNIVTRASAWHSLHEYGLAGDLVFRDRKGNYFWPKDADPAWKDLGNVGKMFGLRWGGDWPIDLTDLDHFEMRPPHLTMDQMKNILFTEGLKALWDLI